MRKTQKKCVWAVLESNVSLQRATVWTSTMGCGRNLHFLRLVRTTSMMQSINDSLITSVWSDKRFASSSSSNPSSTEDQDDIERERLLREKFSKKIMGLENRTPHAVNFPSSENNQQQPAAPFPSFNTFGGATFPFSQTPPFSQESPKPGKAHRSLLFWLLILLPLPFVLAASRWKSISEFRWQELPILSTSHYVLLRSILSRKEQYRIENEFMDKKKANPYLSLEEFMRTFYPNIFQGYATTQEEIVAAVATCLSTEDSIRFLRTIGKAAWATMDTKAAVDRVMEALRREYPQNFIT